MKLTRGKLLETIRRKNEGWTTYQARKIGGVSVRRVNQVMWEYERSGEAPEIGRRVGRPKKPLEEWEITLVHETWLQYRVSATTLTRLIRRDHDVKLEHNRIHKILLLLGFASCSRPAIIPRRRERMFY